MAAPSLRLLTPEQYLAAEEKAETKHEYYRGMMLAMAGGSTVHSQIGTSVAAVLWTALRRGPCRVYTSDARVAAAGDGSHFTYADVVVACGELRGDNRWRETLMSPVLIVEVLSPSTESADRGRKAIDYRKLESLREYLLISQFEPRVELYRRTPGGAWELLDFTGLDAVIPLASVDCTLALADAYDKVIFEPEVD